MDDAEKLEALNSEIKTLRSEIAKRIVGQDNVIDDLLACLFSGGHCLLIGVPGLAKTMLVHTLAESLDLDFNRIQFTPDLMPADITGSEVLNEDKVTGERTFRFIKGPVFSNVILADEINRTPPKTQSALLQSMQEKTVTSSGKTYELPTPFWTLATQNPIEHEGTYPLPEAQQDRFMFSVSVGYPDYDSEIEIVKRTTSDLITEIKPVLNADKIREYIDLVRRIPVSDTVYGFAVNLVRASRPEETDIDNIKRYLTWGAGPRASQFLILASKAYAAIEGRPAPDFEDVKRAAHPVLSHRLVRSFNAEADGVDVSAVIDELISGVNPE